MQSKLQSWSNDDFKIHILESFIDFCAITISIRNWIQGSFMTLSRSLQSRVKLKTSPLKVFPHTLVESENNSSGNPNAVGRQREYEYFADGASAQLTSHDHLNKSWFDIFNPTTMNHNSHSQGGRYGRFIIWTHESVSVVDKFKSTCISRFRKL